MRAISPVPHKVNLFDELPVEASRARFSIAFSFGS